jgi:tetratricopeptide (TPR) repeat protein
MEPYVNGRAPKAELLVVAARVEAHTKRFADAERLLQQAVRIDPALQPAYTALGQLYVAWGRLPDARREFEAVAARQARPVAALTMLGMIAQAQQEAGAARSYFERALEIEPAAPVASNNLAWIYAEQGDRLDAALRLAESAARVLPKAAEVQDTLGWVHYRRGSGPEAVAALKRSVQRAPGNPVYRYHLGLAHQLAGDTASARDTLERALALDPAFSGAADARRVLASLRASGITP